MEPGEGEREVTMVDVSISGLPMLRGAQTDIIVVLVEEMDIYKHRVVVFFRIASQLKQVSLIRTQVLHVMILSKLTRGKRNTEAENGAPWLFALVLHKLLSCRPSM